MVWSRRSLVMAHPAGPAACCSRSSTGWCSPRKLPPQVTRVRPLRRHRRLLLRAQRAARWPRSSTRRALIADEVEGKTLTYLLTRPVPRASILGRQVRGVRGHDARAWRCPAVVLTFFLLMTGSRLGRPRRRRLPDLFRDIGVLALAPRGLRRLLHAARRAAEAADDPRAAVPVRLGAAREPARLHAAVHRSPPTCAPSSATGRPTRGWRSCSARCCPSGDCLLALAGIFAFCLGAGIWIFSSREYVLDQ